MDAAQITEETDQTGRLIRIGQHGRRQLHRHRLTRLILQTGIVEHQPARTAVAWPNQIPFKTPVRLG